MALVSLGGVIQWPDYCGRWTGTPSIATANVTMTATGQYTAWVGMAREAMSVTHFGVLTGTITGTSAISLSIETVDGTTGQPTGVPISASASVTVSGVVSTTFYQGALAGTATIPAGTVFAAVVRYLSGTSIGMNSYPIQTNMTGGLPFSASTTGSAIKTGANTRPWALGSSTGTWYQLDGMWPAISATAGLMSGSGATNAKALRFKVPFKCRCAGLVLHPSNSTTTNFDIAMLNDAGTELSSSRTTFDKDNVNFTSTFNNMLYFDNPVTLSADTWYRATVFAASGGNVSFGEVVMPGANYISAYPHKANAHIAYFTSSAWDDTHTEIIPVISLILDQLDDGVNTATGGTAHGVVGT